MLVSSMNVREVRWSCKLWHKQTFLNRMTLTFDFFEDPKSKTGLPDRHPMYHRFNRF